MKITFSNAFLLAALPYLTGASPITPGTKIQIKRGATLNIDGVVNKAAATAQMGRTMTKIQNGMQAFQQNTGSAHPASQALQRRNWKRADSGGVSLEDDQQTLWFGEIQVGTPPKSFTVDFDTGSSDLFLPSVNCNANCDGHTLFDAQKSASVQNLNKQFSTAFGDGSTTSGNQVTDQVTIAGLTADKQTLGDATEYSSGFAIDAFKPDGLMGMASPDISAFPATPFFNTLIEQGKVAKGQFAFKLTTDESELFLGGVNPALFSGDFTNVPVTDPGFWQVDVDSANVDGKATSGKQSTIIDTGTTLLIMDSKSAASFYQAIPGSADASQTVGPGFFTFPCDGLPEVALTFGGQKFVMDESTFNLGQVDQGSQDCVGGAVAMDGTPFWIVGDVFLQNTYTSFSFDKNEVGFAKLA